MTLASWQNIVKPPQEYFFSLSLFSLASSKVDRRRGDSVIAHFIFYGSFKGGENIRDYMALSY